MVLGRKMDDDSFPPGVGDTPFFDSDAGNRSSSGLNRRKEADLTMQVGVLTHQVTTLVGKVSKLEATNATLVKEILDLKTMMKTLLVIQGSGGTLTANKTKSHE